MAALFAATIPATILLTLGVFRWRQTPATDRSRAAALLASPGLLPLAYGVVLVTGLQSGR